MKNVIREENGMHPLPSSSVKALRKLFENAIDAIDQGLIQDAGDAGLVAYALNSVVAGSSNVPEDDAHQFQGAHQDFVNGSLLDLEEESAIPLMTKLFGFDWQRYDMNYESFRVGIRYELLHVGMRKDGKRFIKHAGR